MKSKSSNGKKSSKGRRDSSTVIRTDIPPAAFTPPPLVEQELLHINDGGRGTDDDPSIHFILNNPDDLVRYFESYCKRKTSLLQSQEFTERDRQHYEIARNQFLSNLDTAIIYLIQNYDLIVNSQNNLYLRLQGISKQLLHIEKYSIENRNQHYALLSKLYVIGLIILDKEVLSLLINDISPIVYSILCNALDYCTTRILTILINNNDKDNNITLNLIKNNILTNLLSDIIQQLYKSNNGDDKLIITWSQCFKQTYLLFPSLLPIHHEVLELFIDLQDGSSFVQANTELLPILHTAIMHYQSNTSMLKYLWLMVVKICTKNAFNQSDHDNAIMFADLIKDGVVSFLSSYQQLNDNISVFHPQIKLLGLLPKTIKQEIVKSFIEVHECIGLFIR